MALLLLLAKNNSSSSAAAVSARENKTEQPQQPGSQDAHGPSYPSSVNIGSAGPSIALIRTKIEVAAITRYSPHGLMRPPEEENSHEPFQRLHSSHDRLLQLW